MTPSTIVLQWVQRFNLGDIDGLLALYANDAVCHQVVNTPLTGRTAIRRMFEVEFGRAKMHCVIENLLESGEWAALEWSDPAGLRGCGFFLVAGLLEAAGNLVPGEGIEPTLLSKLDFEKSAPSFRSSIQCVASGHPGFPKSLHELFPST